MKYLPLLLLAAACSRPTFDKLDEAVFGAAPTAAAAGPFPAATAKPALTIPGHSEHGVALAFSPDGKALATVQAGMGVYFWDPETRYVLGSFMEKEIGAIAFAPDGKSLAAAKGDGKIVVLR